MDENGYYSMDFTSFDAFDRVLVPVAAEKEEEPSATPTNTPEEEPSATPTNIPEEEPSATPTGEPAAEPTQTPQ